MYPKPRCGHSTPTFLLNNNEEFQRYQPFILVAHKNGLRSDSEHFAIFTPRRRKRAYYARSCIHGVASRMQAVSNAGESLQHRSTAKKSAAGNIPDSLLRLRLSRFRAVSSPSSAGIEPAEFRKPPSATQTVFQRHHAPGQEMALPSVVGHT